MVKIAKEYYAEKHPHYKNPHGRKIVGVSRTRKVFGRARRVCNANMYEAWIGFEED
jgi:hypothetical protein